MDKELKQLISGLNKDFGDGTIITEPIKVDFIPTGSFSLDKALGIGGLPKGKIVEIYGPESGGKTSLALSVIAQTQKLGGTAGYIDVEQALDPVYAKSIGVNFEDMILTQPSKGEDALNIMMRMIESNKFDVVVLDSIAALEPSAESDGEIGIQTMGLKARLMSQAMRKMIPIISRTNTLAIFINQIRMKIGVLPYQNPETTPGGNAMKFAASVRLDIRRTSTIKGENDEPIGILVKAKVIKNKVAPPYKQAEYSLIFGKGISIPIDLFNTALKENIIRKDGNTYYLGDKKIGVGVRKCIEEIENNKELQEELIKLLK